MANSLSKFVQDDVVVLRRTCGRGHVVQACRACAGNGWRCITCGDTAPRCSCNDGEQLDCQRCQGSGAEDCATCFGDAR